MRTQPIQNLGTNYKIRLSKNSKEGKASNHQGWRNQLLGPTSGGGKITSYWESIKTWPFRAITCKGSTMLGRDITAFIESRRKCKPEKNIYSSSQGNRRNMIRRLQEKALYHHSYQKPNHLSILKVTHNTIHKIIIDAEIKSHHKENDQVQNDKKTKHYPNQKQEKEGCKYASNNAQTKEVSMSISIQTVTNREATSTRKTLAFPPATSDPPPYE